MEEKSQTTTEEVPAIEEVQKLAVVHGCDCFGCGSGGSVGGSNPGDIPGCGWTVWCRSALTVQSKGMYLNKQQQEKKGGNETP